MSTGNLTESQRRGRAQHLQYQRETMEKFCALLKEAESLARGSGCIDKQGLELYSIRNTVQLKLRDLPTE